MQDCRNSTAFTIETTPSKCLNSIVNPFASKQISTRYLVYLVCIREKTTIPKCEDYTSWCWLSQESVLTHLPLVLHTCVSDPDQYWFRKWLGAYSAPSHYLNKCWFIVNWILRKKFQWKFNRNSNIFVRENAFEKVVCETVVILSRGGGISHPPLDKVTAISQECFQMHFREWKVIYFDWNFTEVCS